MLLALVEEFALGFDDGDGDFEEPIAAVANRIDNRVGGFELLLDVVAGLFVGAGLLEHAAELGRDAEFALAGAGEADVVGVCLFVVFDDDVGHDGRRGLIDDIEPGMEGEASNREQRFLDVVDFDGERFGDLRQAVFLQVFKLRFDDFGFEAGVLGEGFELKLEAFLEIPRRDAWGVQLLDAGERILHAAVGWDGVELGGELLEGKRESAGGVEGIDDGGAERAGVIVDFGEAPLVEEVVLEAAAAGGGVGHRLEFHVALFAEAGAGLCAAEVGFVVDPVVFGDEVVESREVVGVAFGDAHGFFAFGALGGIGFDLGRGVGVFGGLQLERGVVVDFLLDAGLERHRVELQDIHGLDELRREALLLLEQVARDLAKHLRHTALKRADEPLTKNGACEIARDT